MTENDVKILFSEFYDFSHDQWLLLKELQFDNYIKSVRHEMIPAGYINTNNVPKGFNILRSVILNDGTVVKIY